MFKKILKIVGIVIGVIAVLFGGMVGIMALRGDFKREVIKPSAISFEVSEMKLQYDATKADADNTYSFIVSAQPANVNVTECAIKVSDPSMITFRKKVYNQSTQSHEWQDYNSTVFHVNEPIYFVLNENAANYNDGEFTITVEAGLLQTTLTMQIDRKVTSLSIKDVVNSANNGITNGKFEYENNADDINNVEQKLDAVINQDYPLEVIAAPYMSLKPFASKDAKKVEIYYMEAGQPRLLVDANKNSQVASWSGEKVRIEVINEDGTRDYKDCDFLRYDATIGQLVLNSSEAGAYKFKLAVHRTYDEEELYGSQTGLLLTEHLSYMLTKDVTITVTGTDADNIAFHGSSQSVTLKLFEENELVLNNYNADKFNLGLTLSKNNGLEIENRFAEVEFLDKDDFYANNIVWTFEDNATKNPVTIRFYDETQYGSKRAVISGLDAYGIKTSYNFYARLISGAGGYVLELQNKAIEGEHQYTITINLDKDANSEKLLEIKKVDEDTKLVEIDGVDNTVYKDLKFVSGPRLVVDNERTALADDNEFLKIGGAKIYNFKAIQPGVYLTLLKDDPGDNKEVIVDASGDYKTRIEQDTNNYANSRVFIMPIENNTGAKYLYAFVVNEDGNVAWTKEYPYMINIDVNSPKITVNETEVWLPVDIDTNKSDVGIKVEDDNLAVASGSYTSVLAFAPKEVYVPIKNADTLKAVWTKAYELSDGAYIEITSEPSEFVENKYYIKQVNRFKFIDSIYITDKNTKIKYYLLGYIDNNKFKNEIVATGINDPTTVYFMVPKTNYLTAFSRLQTASEYVEDLLGFNSVTYRDCAATVIVDGTSKTGTIKYDISLLRGRKVIDLVDPDGEGKWTEPTDGSYYLIKNVQYSATTITITGSLYNKNGEEQNKEATFEISRTDYENVEGIKIASATDEWFEDSDGVNKVTINSYYKFNDTNKEKVNVDFTGSYFRLEEIAKDANGNYYLIENHKDVSESVKYGETVLKNTEAIVRFSINDTNKYGILYHLNSSSKLTVATYVYDNYNNLKETNSNVLSYGNIEKVVPIFESEKYYKQDGTKLTEEPTDWETNISDYRQYITADNRYFANETYYKYDEGTKIYSVADDIPEDIKQEDWKNLYWKYYVLSGVAMDLGVKVTANGTLNTGWYAKVAWVYSCGDYEIAFESDKLYILSRDVTGYTINTRAELFVPTVVTAPQGATEPENWATTYTNYYTLDRASNTYSKVAEGANAPTFEAGKYFDLTSTKYEGQVCYTIVVGYDTTSEKYTYTVYAVDENGNYLYKPGDGGAIELVSTALSNAFSMGTDGWIQAEPIYAEEPDFKLALSSNNKADHKGCIVFEDNLPTINRITDEFVDVDIINQINPTVSSAIKVKIIQDNKFIAPTPSAVLTAGMEEGIVTGYKYNGTNIDKLLSISVANLSIEKAGQDVTAFYELTKSTDNGYAKLTYTNLQDASDKITISYDTTPNNKWKVTRTQYVIVDMNVVFESILGTHTYNFKFTNPYKIRKSESNLTDTLYSGTKFVLAYIQTKKTEGAEGFNEDYVYNLVSYSPASFTVDVYSLDDDGERQSKETTLSSVVNNEMIWTVSPVDSETIYEFAVMYNGQEIHSFKMKVKPNYVATNVGAIVELDDNLNKTYILKDVEINAYDTSKTYKRYDSEDLNPATLQADNTNYQYTVYTDSEMLQQSDVDIVSINNGVLTVKPISKNATYYIRLNINVVDGDTITVATIIFKVTSSTTIEGNNLEVAAKTDKEYTLEEINKLFSAYQNGDYKPADKFVEGETYEQHIDYELMTKAEFDLGIDGYKKIDDDNYESVTEFTANETYKQVITYTIMQTDNGSGYYIKDLTAIKDVLYLDHNNNALNITYNYVDGYETIAEFVEGETYKEVVGAYELMTQEEFDAGNLTAYKRKIYSIKQTGDKANRAIEIDGTIYNFIGNTWNFEGLKYNPFAEDKITKIADGTAITPTIQGNILYSTNEGGNSVAYIYGIENVYLFKTTGKIVAITINDDGYKVLYFFTVTNEDTNSTISLTQKTLTEFANITLNYNAYGEDLTKADFVTSFEFNTDFILEDNMVFKSQNFVLNVKPYTLTLNVESIISNKDYLIADLFTYDEDVVDKTAISASANITFKGEGGTTIYAEAVGNQYVENFAITLTYKDGSKYTYIQQITVKNRQTVNIDYLFGADLDGKTDLEAKVDEFTNAVDGTNYDTADLEKWLGKNTFNYDLILAGDIVNLTQDDVMARFSVIEENDTTTPVPKKIELVAVSQSLANTLQNVTNNVQTLITETSAKIYIANSFNLAGYLLFKVYVGDNASSAYGYYAVRVESDASYKQVNAGTTDTYTRTTETITQTITNKKFDLNGVNTSATLYNIILNHNKAMSTISGVSNYLIDSNWENVELYNIGDTISGELAGEAKEYPKHSKLDKGLILNSQINVQNFKIAVVLTIPTDCSAHICNYNIVIKSNVTVSEGTYIETSDHVYHKYVAVATQFNYEDESKNTLTLSDYLTATQNGENIGLYAVAFSDKYMEDNTSGISASGEEIKYKDAETNTTGTIATIDKTNKKLALTAGVKHDMSFWLKLTYGNSGQFTAYLQINLTAYARPNTASERTVGTWTGSNFNNELSIETLIGQYIGAKEIKYGTTNGNINTTVDANSENVTLAGDNLVFTQGTEQKTYYVSIKLADIVPSITYTYKITVLPSISATHTKGDNSEDPVTTTKSGLDNGLLPTKGSSLYVDISGAKVIIKSSNGDGATEYLTINAGAVTSLDFNLYDGENPRNEYILSPGVTKPNKDNGETFLQYRLNTNGTINFVHMPAEKEFRLEIIVNTDRSSYQQVVLYIKLEQTYELVSNYRVEGATFENMLVGEKLKYGMDTGVGATNPIDEWLFGGGSDGLDEGTNIYSSRFAVRFIADGKPYYGIGNLSKIGFFDENNPNKLDIKKNSTSNSDVAQLDALDIKFVAPGEYIIDITNTAGASVSYKFIVQTEITNNDVVTLADGLGVEYTANGEISHINIASNKIDNDGITIATLAYNASMENGLVAYVHDDNADVEANIDGNKITLKGKMSSGAITIKIVTMNGLAKTLTVVVSNLTIKYGYGALGYEPLYANTEGYKFTDTINVTGESKTRLTGVTVGQLTYVGAENGIANAGNWDGEADYSYTDESVVYYKDSMFGLRSVASDKYVTMIFEVKSGNYVIGRVFYVLLIKRDIKIGINGQVNNTNVDVYLGSDAYGSVGKDENYRIVVDLVSKTMQAGGHNVFITLERYSTGNTIANGNALYNGTASILTENVFSNHLVLQLDNISGLKVEVNSTDKYKLNISNHEGSFDLIISSSTIVGYYERYTIKVHPVVAVETKFDTSINSNGGPGFRSGDSVALFASMEDIQTTYAINARKAGVTDIKGTVKYSTITTNDATVYYQMKTFDYDSTIEEIKNSTGWGTSTVISESKKEINLPSVPYSATGTTTLYSIVSIKVTVNSRGVINEYYAHYKVYNDTNMILNDYYNPQIQSDKTKHKTVTYTDASGAWQSGSTITIMDLNNQGMYAMVEPLTAQPEDWTENYGTYYEKDQYGIYVEVSADEATGNAPQFKGGSYYRKHTLASGIFEKLTGENAPAGWAYNYNTYYVKSGVYVLNTSSTYSKDTFYKEVLSFYVNAGDGDRKLTNIGIGEDNGVPTNIYATLPNNLFNNSAEVQFIIKNNETNTIIFEDTWTLKSGNAITPYATMPVSDFFLRSEVGDYLYGKEIIGISTYKYGENGYADDWVKFVQNANGVIKCEDKTSGFDIFKNTSSIYFGYSIYEVTFKGNVSDTLVCRNTEVLYILAGKKHAMSFDFNGGTYYINVPIIDSNIVGQNAVIYIEQFVKIWKFENNSFTSSAANITISSVTAGKGVDIIDADDDQTPGERNGLKLSDVHKHNSNFSVTINITATIDNQTISRDISVYFNFIMSAKNALVGTNKDLLEYVTGVEEAYKAAVEDDAPVTITDSTLKGNLLEVIKFNNLDIDESDYDKFTIEMQNTKVNDNSYGYIQYTYNYNGIKYERTFRIALSAS